MVHTLKCRSEYYQRILNGTKTFEIRLNDRDYQVGDKLWLEEINKHGIKTFHSCLVEVIYITSFEQRDGYVVMGIKFEKENV